MLPPAPERLTLAVFDQITVELTRDVLLRRLSRTV
jgi:hypothetical protein